MLIANDAGRQRVPIRVRMPVCAERCSSGVRERSVCVGDFAAVPARSPRTSGTGQRVACAAPCDDRSIETSVQLQCSAV